MESFESPVIGTIVKIDEVESIKPNSVLDTSHTGEPYTTPVTLTNVTSEEVNTKVTTAEVTNIPFLTPNNKQLAGVTPEDLIATNKMNVSTES